MTLSFLICVWSADGPGEGIHLQSRGFFPRRWTGFFCRSPLCSGLVIWWACLCSDMPCRMGYCSCYWIPALPWGGFWSSLGFGRRPVRWEAFSLINSWTLAFLTALGRVQPLPAEGDLCLVSGLGSLPPLGAEFFICYSWSFLMPFCFSQWLKALAHKRFRDWNQVCLP